MRVSIRIDEKGGAGVGKTLLLVKKVAKEVPSKRILCVSRLSKLMNKIKSSVEDMRTEELENVDFLVYDELVSRFDFACLSCKLL